MLSFTRQNRELVNVLWWTDLFQVGLKGWDLVNGQTSNSLGIFRWFRYNNVVFKMAFCGPWFLFDCVLEILEKKGHEFGQQNLVIQKRHGQDPTTPMARILVSSPERHLSGGHLSAPETRQRMKRPWGAKSTSMSRPCHGTFRPLGSKASSCQP